MIVFATLPPNLLKILFWIIFNPKKLQTAPLNNIIKLNRG